MKATRLRTGKDVNPLFSHDAKSRAKAAGVPYETPEFLIFPAGEMVEDPNVWMHCVGTNPEMLPADKECADCVLAKMTDPDRQAFLSRLRRLRSPEIRKQLSKDDLKSLDLWDEIYGDEADSPPDLSKIVAVAQAPAAAPAIVVPAAVEVVPVAEAIPVPLGSEGKVIPDEPAEAEELPEVV